MLESTLEKRLGDKVKELGGFYFKLDPRTISRGIPDRMVLLPQNTPVAFYGATFVECKVGKNKLEPLQVFWRDRLLAMGYNWIELRKLADFFGVK